MTEPAAPHPMPFDLWWSPSMKRLLSRHENRDDEHLAWVVQMNHESLRHYLGTGADSNPPLPDDAVRLVLADPEQGSEPHAAHDRFIPSVMSKLKGWQQELTTREQYVLDAAMEVHLALTKHQVDEMADFAGVQANARRESDRVRNLAARQAADLRDELATARQETEDVRESHALVVSDRDELSIKLEDVTIALQGDADFKPVLVNPAVYQIQALRTERDQLQARIDATLALLDAPGGVRYGHLHELRAALQGDQPTSVLLGDETPQPEEDQ